MKTKISTTFIILIISVLSSVNLNAGTKDKVQQDEEVNVFYFHFSTRCETCLAIESETKYDLMELFGGEVIFHVYNLDEETGDAKGKELGVNSQALLVVKGDTKISLTNEGFLYALTEPEKFKKIIEENIRPLL